MFSERVIKGTLVAASASLSLWLVASGSTSLLAERLLKSPPAARKQSAPLLATEQQDAIEIGERVLARNMFDSQSGGMPWLKDEPAPIVQDAGVPMADEATEPTECEGTMRLIATVVSRNPAQSRSTIEHAGTKRLVAIGTLLDDEREIFAIGSHRVLLRNRARRVCSLSMFRPAVSQVAAAPVPAPPVDAAPAAPPASEAAAAAAEMEAGITKISDTQYRVSRVVMDKTLANPTAMMRFARGVPHVENGRNVGMRLASVRASSPLRKLGMLPDDVVRSINGFDLSTPDGALEAYSKLRTQQALSISLSRGGKPMTIEISIE